MKTVSQNKIFNTSTFKQLLNYTKPYQFIFITSIFLSIIISLLSPIRPYLIQLTVESATQNKNLIPIWLLQIIPTNYHQNILKLIFAVTIFQLIFIIFESFIKYIFAYLTALLGQYVVYDIRIKVFQKNMALHLSEYDKTPIGTLTTRTINDVESINEIFSDGFISILADFLTIIVTLVTMFYINWQLSLIALIVFPILIIATYIFKESVNKSFISVRNAVAALNSFVQEHLINMQLIQTNTAEKKEFEKFSTINNQHKNANIKAIFAYSVFFPIVEIVLAISIGLIVWYVAGKKLPVGLLISFILFLNQIYRPLRVIADKFNVFQMGMIAAERVFKIFQNTEFQHSNDIGIKKNMQGNISFKHVSFYYELEKWVLNDVSFSVNKGETLAIIGKTGSGKSSIVQLINRLYQHQLGKIYIDDISIEDFNLLFLRKNIAVVSQDLFLFSSSILDNITLKDPSISFEKVVEISTLLGVHDFILSLPEGYNYQIKERGASLSVGQKQIICFIRALINNPSILILDEATSSIDKDSENLIKHATEKMIKGRTTIIIAHRLATINNADKILVLDNGVVVEYGTHKELINNKKIYSTFFAIQQNNSL